MDLWTREARLFKYGSGTGTNFSPLRGENEKLSGGGKSSGLMSFLKIGDRAAGAIKSGGTTRRAAKMVIVDIDHPDIEDFIDWKVIEEQKVAALVAGSKIVRRSISKAVMKACVNCEGSGGDCFELEKNPALRRAVKAARRKHDPRQLIERVISSRARATRTSNSTPMTPTGTAKPIARSPARIPTTPCASPTTSSSRSGRRRLGPDRAAAARSPRPSRRASCGTRSPMPPGPAPIPASSSTPPSMTGTPARRGRNPRLQSVQRIHVPGRHRLQSGVAQPDAVPQAATAAFDVEAFEHAVRLWTIVLEISVLMAQFPSKEIAQLSYDYRTLGLGFANIGGLLMTAGVPYDSREGRAICGAISALMTGVSYATSAEMAGELGAFPEYRQEREPCCG